jgi:hypothetical protein
MITLFSTHDRALRRAAALLSASLLAAALACPAALAQGGGRIEGKLLNLTDASIACAAVDLEVVGLGSGMSVIKSTKSDASGRFRVDGLPTDEPLMVRADYKSVNYHSRITFNAEGKAEVTIEVYEPTASRKDVVLEGVRIAFQLSGGRLRSLESYSFNNRTRPPRTYVHPEGSLRFSKAPGILEVPQVSLTAPGSSMPLKEAPLESADGGSYYLLYPLRPGVSTFEVEQVLPYQAAAYVYRKKFYEDLASLQIGVIPHDMNLAGEGLVRVQTDPQRNFAIYAGGPVKAGAELVWTFSGGTPVPEPRSTEATSAESRIQTMGNAVGRNALIIGPPLLMAFLAVLWYAFSRLEAAAAVNQDPGIKALRTRRDQLLNYMADLDHRLEILSMDRRAHARLRERAMRQLRRVALLLGNK